MHGVGDSVGLWLYLKFMVMNLNDSRKRKEYMCDLGHSVC